MVFKTFYQSVYSSMDYYADICSSWILLDIESE